VQLESAAEVALEVALRGLRHVAAQVVGPDGVRASVGRIFERMGLTTSTALAAWLDGAPATLPRVGDRRLSFLDATLLVMGGVIGVGIFFTPHDVARLLPAPAPFFGVWALGGLIGLAGALTFAELAATFPHAGGWYVFLREAFGRLPAFLFAWIVLLVVSTGASAVIADFCATQVARLLWADGDVPAGAHGALGAGLIVLITAVALAGAKSGARLQNACMLLKLGALLAFAGAAFLLFEPPAAAPAAPGAWSGADFVRAVLPVLFSYGGWQFVTYVAPAVRDPQRTLPRAILTGMLAVVAVYLLANAAFVRVVGLSGVAADRGFAADVARGALGELGGALLIAAMAVSSLGVCTAILMTSPWVYVAMARDGLFFRSIGAVSPRSGAPANALLLQGAVALGYFAWGRASILTDAVVFAEWIFHAQCGLALLLLRRRRPELPRPFRSPLYPLFPALYALLATGVVVSVVAGAVQDEAQRSQALIGLGVLAAGGVAFAGWRRNALRTP